MRHLLSKIVAGGLSAGVILLWWPLVFPSDTIESWLIRGVLWTLCFELMLHAFAPLEESLWRTRAARQVAAQAAAATARLATGSPRKRHHGRMAIAAIALFVPLALLATAPAHRLSTKPVAAAASVRHVTEVRRVVRVERRRVIVPRTAVPAAAAQPTPQSAGTTISLGSRSRGAARRPAARSAAPRRSASGRTGSGTTGRRSGSTAGSGSSSTPADTTAQTPSAGSGTAAGERVAAPATASPKRLPLAAP